MPRSTVDGWVHRPPGRQGRFEACFVGAPFSAHRHDSYTFCVTVAGVQVFDYRGATRYSLANQIIVLHPDEKHDGRAGTDGPFRYRAVNIQPAQLQTALGGAPLPHLDGGVSTDPRLAAVVRDVLCDFDRVLEPLEYEDGLYALARSLSVVCGAARISKAPVNFRAAERARAFIDAVHGESVSMDDLERVADHDRWQLSRDFRVVFGTSPYRYAVLRRLDRARLRLEQGAPGAKVAAECGFSDQSHLIRQFRQAYGLSPRQWCASLQPRARSECTIVQ